MAIIGTALVASTARGAPVSTVNADLVQARQHKAALQYAAANKSLDRALRSGRNTPAELAEIYRLRGEIEATLGNRAQAVDQFRRWIAVDPSAALPPGTSPKLTDPFDSARTSFSNAVPLQLQRRLEADPPQAVVTVVGDSLRLVAGMRVEYRVAGGAWRADKVLGTGVLRVSLPRAEGLGVVVTVIDRHGNALAVYGARDQPLVVSTVAPVVSPPALSAAKPRRRSLFARWPFWTGVAIALAGGTTYLALDARSAQRDLDDIYSKSATTEYSSVSARIASLERRGRRSAWMTNVGLGLTGAAGLAAAVLAITGRRASVRPAPGGATVSVALRF